MIDFTFKSVKSSFFDRRAVTDPLEQAKRKRLSMFGAYVRQRVRSSVRKRKQPSAPGTPPSSPTGIYRSSIFFAEDRSSASVVIGPVYLNKSDGKAPALLEYGGAVVRMDRRTKKSRQMRYPARPHMQPAFEAELSKEPQRWAGMVKPGG